MLKPASAMATPISYLSVVVSLFTSFPNTFTLPDVGLISPSIDLINVLFPAPFLPIIPEITPPGMFSEIFRLKSSYCFTRLSTSTMSHPPK